MRKHKQPSQAPKQSRAKMATAKTSKSRANVSVQQILERRTPRSSSKSHRIESTKRIQKGGAKRRDASPNLIRKSSPITMAKTVQSQNKPKNQRAMQVAQSHANMKLKQQDQILSALHPNTFVMPEAAKKGPNYWVKQLHEVKRPAVGDHVRNNQSFGGYPPQIDQGQDFRINQQQQVSLSENISQKQRNIVSKEPIVYIETAHGYQKVKSDQNGQFIALSGPASSTTSVLQGQIQANRSRQNGLPSRHSQAASRNSARSSIQNSTAPCYSINIPPGRHLNQNKGQNYDASQSNYHISYQVVDQNKMTGNSNTWSKAGTSKVKKPSKSRSRSRSVKKVHAIQKTQKIGGFEAFQKNSGKYPQNRRSELSKRTTSKSATRKYKNKNSSVIGPSRSRSRVSRSRSARSRQIKQAIKDNESDISVTRRRKSSSFLIPAHAPIIQGRIVDCASNTQKPLYQQDINRSISSQQKSFRTLQHDEYEPKKDLNQLNSKRTNGMVGDSPYSENKNSKSKKRGQGGTSARSLTYDNYQLPEERRSFLGRSMRQSQNPFVIADMKQQMFGSSIGSSDNSDIFYPDPDQFQQYAIGDRGTPNIKTKFQNPHQRSVSIAEDPKKKRVQKSTPRSMALPFKKLKRAASRKSASKRRKPSKMITPKSRSNRKTSAKKSVSSKRKHSKVINFQSQSDFYKVPVNYVPMRIHSGQNPLQKRMNSVTASQPCLQYRKNSWEHILGPKDIEKIEQKQYSQRRSRHCYSSDGEREYRDIIRQVNVYEETQRVGEREIKQEVIEMKVRQENRLEMLKNQMKKSLIEVKETKARLFTGKENSEVPCLKDQVEKISQRIERIIEERHEREQNKVRDRKLRLEMEKMRVRRIMRNNSTIQQNSAQQLKQELLRRLSEQIDEELELVGTQGLSQVNGQNILASFSKKQGIFRSPTHNESLMMSAVDRASRLGHQNSQRSDLMTRPRLYNGRSSCKRSQKSSQRFDIEQVGSHIVADRSRSKSKHGSMKSIESCKSGKSKRSASLKRTSVQKSQSRKRVPRQRNLQEQIYQTECLNSKNSTIVHQCEAIPSSARPQGKLNGVKAKRKSLSRSRTGKVKVLQSQPQPQMSFSQPFEVEEHKIDGHQVSKKLRFHLDQQNKKDNFSEFSHHPLNKGIPQISENPLFPQQQPSSIFNGRENTSPRIQASRGSATTVNRKSILKNSSAKKRLALSPGSQFSRKSMLSDQNSSSSEDQRYKASYQGKGTIPRELIGRKTVYSSSDSDDDPGLRKQLWAKGQVVSRAYQTNMAGVKAKDLREDGKHVSIGKMRI